MTIHDHRPLAFVTGASSGIGRAVALKLADAGHRVVASARNAEALAALAAERPGLIIAEPLDVTDGAAIDTLIDRIEQHHGPVALAILSAGTYIRDSALDFDHAAFSAMLRVNLEGTTRSITALASRMAQRRSGRIMVISSVAGWVGLPGGGAYGAGKAALNALCEAFRPELEREGVTLQLVCPGFVETPLTAKNDFDMPFIIGVDAAAAAIVDGSRSNRFEIAFPWRMVLALKTLRLLPWSLFFAVTRKMLRSEPGSPA